MSKRTSKVIRTPLLGGVAGFSAMFALTGCAEEIQVHGYKTVKACQNANVYDDEFCKTQFSDALKKHQKFAPRYENIEDCETDFGQGKCNITKSETTSSNNYYAFIPFMYGYMMGSNASGRASYSSPVYNTNDSGMRTLSGHTVTANTFNRTGTTTPASRFTQPRKPETFKRGITIKSRGGFGASGRGFGGGGRGFSAGG